MGEKPVSRRGFFETSGQQQRKVGSQLAQPSDAAVKDTYDKLKKAAREAMSDGDHARAVAQYLMLAAQATTIDDYGTVIASHLWLSDVYHRMGANVIAGEEVDMAHSIRDKTGSNFDIERFRQDENIGF